VGRWASWQLSRFGPLPRLTSAMKREAARVALHLAPFVRFSCPHRHRLPDTQIENRPPWLIWIWQPEQSRKHHFINLVHPRGVCIKRGKTGLLELPIGAHGASIG